MCIVVRAVCIPYCKRKEDICQSGNQRQQAKENKHYHDKNTQKHRNTNRSESNLIFNQTRDELGLNYGLISGTKTPNVRRFMCYSDVIDIN